MNRTKVILSIFLMLFLLLAGLAEHLKSEHPRYIFVNGLFGIVCKR